MSELITLVQDAGKGRAFVVLHEEGEYGEMAGQLHASLSAETRALLVRSSPITDSNWSDVTRAFREFLDKNSIRQASFVSFAAASSIVLNLCLTELKLARSVVLVDACTRPHPGWFDLLADRIENFLPLGLPLRSNSRGFDAKSFLQRIRCPVLTVLSRGAGPYVRSQASVFADGLPTGWSAELSGGDQVAELNRHVLNFQKVPAKCPQKNQAA